MRSKLFKKYPPNLEGKDYFIGDLHGCFDEFEKKLAEINFDKSKDRLFSVGDLGDRGPDSPKCVALVEEPWFFAVRGNHEDMLIGVQNREWPSRNFESNGGKWFFNQPESTRKIQAQNLAQLPLMMEVEQPNGKKIGVLHADALFPDWAVITSDDSLIYGQQDNILWGRTRIGRDDTSRVLNIDAIVVGHTPLLTIVTLGNVVYIDTGIVYGKTLTVLSAEEVLEQVNE